MNKNMIITLIVILCVISIALTVLMIFTITNKNSIFSFFNYENEIILEKTYSHEEIKKIEIESSSTDIDVKESDNQEIKVVVEGRKNEQATVDLNNNILKVSKDKKNNICIGFCFYNDRITVYIPKNIEKELEINSSSGEINIDSFDKINGNLKTNSGDIKIGNINILNAKTSSGDIEIEKIFESCDIKTSSGDVRINQFFITNDSGIETSSGDVTIRNINDVYVDTKTSSGDIDISNNNRYAEYTLKINTSSGDIKVK